MPGQCCLGVVSSAAALWPLRALRHIAHKFGQFRRQISCNNLGHYAANSALREVNEMRRSDLALYDAVV